MRKLASLSHTSLLALATVASTADAGGWRPAEGRLMTRWAEQVSPENALPEYPRPQMVRGQWQNLNGLWDYALSDAEAATPPPRSSFGGKILVPFPYEAPLSGVGGKSIPHQRLWYRRTFNVPADWKGQRVLLHFGAVNWACEVSVNGKAAGQHKGGYNAFRFDVTDLLRSGENEIVVSVVNPLRYDVPEAQALGKQRVHSSGIFYTAATGIWQTVWLEPVPAAAHIERLKITPDVDHAEAKITVEASSSAPVKVTVRAGEQVVAEIAGQAGEELHLPLPNPHLWSPDDPYLYDLKATLADGDTVESYFGMRKISVGVDAQGTTRVLLNNQFVFQRGVLDQGYWPDGIYTAPTDAALRHDLEMTKNFGFNLSRKHAKVEPARWYYWADKLGVLVWQDMPQMFGAADKSMPKGGQQISDEAKAQFEAEWREEIQGLYNSPAIVLWTVFNEGWGQHDTEKLVGLTRQLDPTRLVNNASGWTDKGVGDIQDTHSYPNPWCGTPTPTRAAVCGEFGGLGMSVDGHMWSKDAWGYHGVLKRQYDLDKKLQGLFKVAYKLRDTRGMSAFVYTQLTDVEQEGNGLLTYDRETVKPDPALASDAVRGEFPPLPPDPNPPIVVAPTSQAAGAVWRYALDRPAGEWTSPAFDDHGWQAGEAPFGQGVAGVRTTWKTADIWIRREVEAPEKLPSRLVFSVLHDEDAEVFVNGVLAAKVTGYDGQYVELPMNEAGRRALHAGKNTLAVHCHQTEGGQSIDVGIIGFD